MFPFFLLHPSSSKQVSNQPITLYTAQHLTQIADDESLVCYMRAIPLLLRDSPFLGSSGCVMDCGPA